MAKRVSFYDKNLIKRYQDRVLKLSEQLGDIEASVAFKKLAQEKFDNSLLLGTCNSSSALHLAMCALDMKRGDKVVCSVNSFVDVPEVVRHFDAEPIFVDCEPDTYNIDLDKLDQTLQKNRSKKLRAVIINHMAGLPVDMERVNEIAKKHNVAVIEDATDALGATQKGMPIGCGFCEMSIFSIGSKVDNVFDTGVITFKDKEHYDRAKLLMNHALTYDNSELSYLYDVVDIGCQYRMSELEAMYAIPMMEDIEQNIARRKEIANIYFERLSGLKHVSLPVKRDDHIYTYFIVEIDKNRDAFAKELIKNGVEVGLNYMPLHLTKYYKNKYEFKVFDFPVVLNAYQKILSLPIHASMSNEDVEYVCSVVIEADKKHI